MQYVLNVFKVQQINCGKENCPMDIYIHHYVDSFSIVIARFILYSSKNKVQIAI